MTTGSPPHSRSQSSGRGSSQQVKAVASGSLGNALEYFDFAIYGALAATIFPKLFFGGMGETGALLASFATFGVGFVARPVGALVLGHLGDKFGRRPILFATLVMMGGASILIGLLPTDQGISIAVVLVLLRAIQGFSLGGEVTGNKLIVMEHCDATRRGFFGSIMTIGSPISQVLANLTIVVLSATLTDTQFESWGWRLPFLGSIVIVAVAFFIRLRVSETPAFEASAKEGRSAPDAESKGWRVLLTQPRQVALLTMAWAGTTLSFYLVAVYGLSFLTSSTIGMSSQAAFLILMIAHAVSVVAALLGGLTCDRIGRKRVWYLGLTGCFVGVALFFGVASSSPITMGLVVTLILSSIQFLSGAEPALFAEQFPTNVRFSGAALSYTITNLLFSSPAPFIAAALAAVGGTSLVAFASLIVIVVSAVAVSKLEEGGGRDLAALGHQGKESAVLEGVDTERW